MERDRSGRDPVFLLRKAQLDLGLGLHPFIPGWYLDQRGSFAEAQPGDLRRALQTREGYEEMGQSRGRFVGADVPCLSADSSRAGCALSLDTSAPPGRSPWGHVAAFGLCSFFMLALRENWLLLQNFFVKYICCNCHNLGYKIV